VTDVQALADFLPRAAGHDGEFAAYSGMPLPPEAAVADEEAVIAALRTVHDPELPVNIYELGLIYSLSIAGNGDVAIEMTLTAPGCPVAGEIPKAVADAVAAVEGVGEVEVRLVWQPAWTKDRMSEDAKLVLGML
jgi:FeS assembly SUF system protein